MNRIGSTLTATATGLALGFGALVAGTPAAVAATPNYVSKAEINKIHKGMTIRQVEREFGVKTVKKLLPGDPDLNTLYYDYHARGEARGAWVQVGYKQVNGTYKVHFWEAYWPWKNRNPADHRGRVTKAKFDKVRAGMDMKQAHRILGTKGDLGICSSRWGNYQTRLYREKSDSPTAGFAVLYKKVNGKWQVQKKGPGPMAHYKKGNPLTNPAR